jgi:hypothetical protein
MLAAGLVMLCVTGLPHIAFAQTAPRIKAVVKSFEGSTLTVLPQGDTAPMKIGVRPATRIMKEEESSLDAINVGDYIGATLTKGAKGALAAQEVHIFPKALSGSGEGLFPPTPGSSVTILNGTVSAAGPAALSVKFRGASGDGPSCSGRALINPIAGCKGEITIAVAANIPVLALMPGDKSQLVPGAVLAISIIAGPDGKPVTPGLTIESVATPPVPLAADKPEAKAKAAAPVKHP